MTYLHPTSLSRNRFDDSIDDPAVVLLVLQIAPSTIIAAGRGGRLIKHEAAIRCTAGPARQSVQQLQLFDELRTRYDIPTQSCVLSHVTSTIEAIERHAPVDLVFQWIAGTEQANAAFGIELALPGRTSDRTDVSARA